MLYFIIPAAIIGLVTGLIAKSYIAEKLYLTLVSFFIAVGLTIASAIVTVWWSLFICFGAWLISSWLGAAIQLIIKNRREL